MERIKLERIMTKDVRTMTQHESVNAAFELMTRHDLRHIPIVDHNDRLIGIISDRDILVDAQRGMDEAIHPSELLISEVMNPKVSTATPDTTLRAAVRLMLDKKIHAVPVVDPSMRVLGLVTSTDVMRLLLEADLVWPQGSHHAVGTTALT
jgi:acetoin utilization protein AcuB